LAERTSGLQKALSSNLQRFCSITGGGAPEGELADPGSPGKMAIKWK